MLGTTDISSISTVGTVTGALSKLNTDLTPVAIDVSGLSWNVTINTTYTYFYKGGRHVFFQVYITSALAASQTLVTLPDTLIPLDNKQRWFVGAEAMGGAATFRASITQTGIFQAIVAGTGVSFSAPFISGVYIAKN